MTSKRDMLFGGVVLLFTVVWFSFFAVARIDLHHDFIMLKPAIDVAEGKTLFRESFCQYGALTIWLQALALKLFGGELIVIRMLNVLFYGGIAFLTDRIFRRFLAFPFRLLNLGLFWGMAPFYIVPMHPWSSVCALFFMLSSTEFLLRFLENGRSIDACLSGVFAACAFLARHPCGAVIFAAGAMTLILAWGYLGRRRSGLGYFALGAAAVTAAFAIYLSLAGAWKDYLHQCFGFVGSFAFERGGGGKWGELVSRFFPIFDGLGLVDIIYSLFPLVCIAVGLRAFSLLGRRSGDLPRATETLAIVLAGLASWHQYYPVPCVRHLYWAAIPMFGVFALACQELWQAGTRRTICRTLVGALLLSAAIPVGVRMYYGALPFLGSFGNRRSVDMAGVRHLRLSSNERMLLETFRRGYEALPPRIRERGIFNWSPDAAFAVIFPPTKFRHPMFVNWEDQVYRDYPGAAAKYIMEHRPPLVSCRELQLPGYFPLCGGELYGVSYWFYAPVD